MCEEWLAAAEDKFGRWPRLRKGVEILTKRAAPPLAAEVRPHFFFLPEVKTKPFFDPADSAGFPWVERLTAGVDSVRQEILDHLKADGLETYGAAYPGVNKKFTTISQNYNTVHFYSKPKQFPKTIALLEEVPLISGEDLYCDFGVLFANGHIKPHTGFFNGRVICHLGLVIPPDCALRVDSEIRQWREGGMLLFDDGYEHEVWNKSDRTRIILNFMVWNPDLELEERHAMFCFTEHVAKFLFALPKDEQLRVLEALRIEYAN